MKLVPMKEEDLSFVNNVRNNSATRSQLKNCELISLEETRQWFNNTNPMWLIIINDDDKIGYMRTSQDTGQTICCGCDIHPDYRGKGFAKNAYKLLIDDFYSRGYILLWLEVFRDNIVAYNLYKKLGFIEAGPAARIINGREYVTMVHVR